MSVTQTDRLLGMTEALLSAADTRQPRKTSKRPAKTRSWGGLNVSMSPISGLTPKGVFSGSDAQHPLGQPYYFQTPPIETFGEDGTASHNDYGTVSSGQHSQFIGRQLRTCQFDTTFLDWSPPWAVYKETGWEPDARRLTDELAAIRDSGKAFLLQAYQPTIRDRYDIYYAATLRSLHWEIRGGEIDAYYITVAFTEFSTPDIQEFLTQSAANPHLPASLAVATLPSDRDTLAKMAKVYYGDPSKWRNIAAANGLSKVPPNTTLSSTVTHRKKITVPRITKPKKATGTR